MVSHHRGIPPLDNANTLYIEREEYDGMLATFVLYLLLVQGCSQEKTKQAH